MRVDLIVMDYYDLSLNALLNQNDKGYDIPNIFLPWLQITIHK